MVENGLSILDMWATDMAHPTRWHLGIRGHLHLRTHGRHLPWHLRWRSRVAIGFRLYTSHARRPSRPLRHLASHGILVDGVKLA